MKFGHPWGKKRRSVESIDNWKTCQGWNFNPVTRNGTWADTLKNCRQRDGKPAKCEADARQKLNYLDCTPLWVLVVNGSDEPTLCRFVNAKP